MCPGHGWCGYGGPSSGPVRPSSGQAVGVRYPLAAGAGVRAWGPSTVPLACMTCWWLRAAGVVGADPPGVAFHRCQELLVSGAVPLPAARPWERAARTCCPCVPGTWWCGHWGPSTGPTSCALASWRCALWRWPNGVPGGGCPLCRCEGRLSSGALPPPAAPPQGGLLGSATHLLWGRVCGRGGPSLSLWLACPAGGCVPGVWPEALPGGVGFHHCEGRLVSGAVPPPAAHPSGRAARVPRPVFPGRGWCGRGDPATAPQGALLRAVVARCGGGGRASPGGAAFHRCEGRLRSGALPPPSALPQGGLSGSATHLLWARPCGRPGQALSLWLACPAGGCVQRGCWEAVPGGDGLQPL